ncbi:MAG: hypothetical protein H7Y07_12655 [Pyrinomonadaceae bacterium]|nr:hypothetical protein [Sphingobacteriaceae bacterium]
MKKERILWLGISVLVLLNISLLLFILLHREGKPNKKFDAIIIKSMQLKKDQIEEFDRLKHIHKMKMDQLDSRMQEPFEHYFGLLKGERQPLLEDSLKNVLAELYKQKVEITYSHFAEIKAMCSLEQQRNIDKIVPFLMQVISPPKKDGPGRGR